jgi:hypothetical protein
MRRIHTYVVRAGQTDAVKIGHAENVHARVGELQIANHEKLRILRIVRGNVETEMHRHFAERRIHGEWFRFCEEMLTWLPPIEEDALLDEYRRALDMSPPPPPETIFLEARRA